MNVLELSFGVYPRIGTRSHNEIFIRGCQILVLWCGWVSPIMHVQGYDHVHRMRIAVQNCWSSGRF